MALDAQLMHPILDALKGTEHDFIRSLLFAFNAGDISKFQTIIPEMNAKEVRLGAGLIVVHRGPELLLSARQPPD